MGLRSWALAVVLVPSVVSGAERIAFIRDGNLWLMDADGTDQEQIGHSGKCGHPYWSPDGKCLVFESAGNIWRMGFPKREIKRLATTGDCHQPAWRPNTSEIWFLRMQPQRPGMPDEVPASMWRVPAGGGPAAWVFKVEGGWGPRRSAWRLDGRALLYDVDVPEGPNTSVYFTDGHRRDNPFPSSTRGERPFCELEPSWSPVNRDLVSMGDNNYMKGSSALWLYDMTKRTFRAIFRPSAPPPNAGVIAWPTWSPDGKRLAFEYVQTDQPTGADGVRVSRISVWVVGLDGRNAEKLAGEAEQPAWSPVLSW